MHTIEEHAAIVIVRWIMLEPGSAAIPARPLLDASERARAYRFRWAADRDPYIAAHALLRATLSRMAGIGAADLRFRTAKSGKPALDPAQALPDLHFTLSHTRGLAACAVGRPHALGIDAEAWRAPAPIELVARYFAPSEARLVAERTPAERPLDLLPALDTQGGLSQGDRPGPRGTTQQLCLKTRSGRNRRRSAGFRGRLALCRVPARARAFARLGGAVAGANPGRRRRRLTA
jgi:hypothetical protein